MSSAASAGRDRAFHWLYALGWVSCAGLAMIYLVLMAAKPELLTGFGAGRRSVAEAGEPRSVARLAEEMQLLRKTVSDMQLNVAHLRTSAASLQESDAAMATRLVALEQRTTPASTTAASVTNVIDQPVAKAAATAKAERIAAQPAAPPAAKPAAAAAPPAAVQQVAAVAPPAVTTRPNIINVATPAAAAPQAPSSPIATGSIAPATVAFGAPVVTAAAEQPVALRLGSGPSLDALRLSWSLLSERHGGVIKDYAPRVAPSAADASSFELLAGPVATVAEAKRVCAQLKARRVACSVGALEGDNL